MTRVVLIGHDPDAVDLSDPALRPGCTAGTIRTGIERGLRQMRVAFDTRPEDGAEAAVRRLTTS